MNEDETHSELTQRLKAAVHFSVGEIVRELELETDDEITFSKQFIAVLAEATYKQVQVLSRDLELFSRHAKRSTINSDDVKLVCRKSSALHKHICEMDEKTQLHNAANRKGKSKNAGKK
ncbi:centromere protein S-like [Tubulanus polymorphus]|uniref:centromere protein S-like n=1 Tax=Tubulanus polymorphus TaxID=672921 RepID=UPI003DA6CC24